MIHEGSIYYKDGILIAGMSSEEINRRSSYFQPGISITGKTLIIYWNGPLVSDSYDLLKAG